MSLQYILSIMRFLTANLKTYTHNSKLHIFNTVNKLQLHKQSTTLTIYQTGAYYGNIKIFNKLTTYTTESVFW